jgi:glycosyltransferase involved in cell wall biosynthesis
MVGNLYDPVGTGLIIVQIPAKNEEKTIAEVIENIPRKINNHNVKILVINDASSDDTLKMAKKAGSHYIFNRKLSEGLGVAFKTGINTCLKLGADVIVNIDADGQFDSRDIPKLVQPILENEADMVTCSRFLKPELTKGISFAKKWGNRRFTKLISRITGQKFTDTQCGFRAYSREAALNMNIKGKFTYTQEVFIDLVEKGMKIKELALPVKYYEKRSSLVSGNLRRYGLKSLSIIAKATRDTRPLTFFGLPGLIIFTLGFLGGLTSFIYWLIYHVTTPIRTLFSVSVFFMVFGISLAILALVADMLRTIKAEQDEILYRLKKREYEKNGGK